MDLSYYRGCWHEISRSFLLGSVNPEGVPSGISSPTTAVYNPKAFIPHAASLGQTCVHCRRFSTAATRRCLGSVSVPVSGGMLSHPIPIFALVSRYLANKLIGHRPLLRRIHTFGSETSSGIPAVSRRYPSPKGTYLCTTLPFAAVRVLLLLSRDLHA